VLYKNWDGRANGKDLNPAVFAYIAIFILPDGSKKTTSGELMLIR
jgi:hypothetical protein